VIYTLRSPRETNLHNLKMDTTKASFAAIQSLKEGKWIDV